MPPKKVIRKTVTYIPKKKPKKRTTCTGHVFQQVMRKYYNRALVLRGNARPTRRQALAFAYQEDKRVCGARSDVRPKIKKAR